jgi:hypothetical protein
MKLRRAQARTLSKDLAEREIDWVYPPHERLFPIE